MQTFYTACGFYHPDCVRFDEGGMNALSNQLIDDSLGFMRCVWQDRAMGLYSLHAGESTEEIANCYIQACILYDDPEHTSVLYGSFDEMVASVIRELEYLHEKGNVQAQDVLSHFNDWLRQKTEEKHEAEDSVMFSA